MSGISDRHRAHGGRWPHCQWHGPCTCSAGFPCWFWPPALFSWRAYGPRANLTAGKDDHDPSEIVIDEVAGQFIALWAISYPSWVHGIDITALWPGWVAGFVLFRLFDITKPGPVGWADRRGDPMGVMLDDVIAGVFAAIGVLVLAGISHGVLGL